MNEVASAKYSGKEHDVLQVTTPEEAQRFKRTYSQPRKRWTSEELLDRFPRDKRHGQKFIADNGEMQRIFEFYTIKDEQGNVTDEYAHEVSRIEYDTTKPRHHPFAVLLRDESQYDNDGYLIYYAIVTASTHPGIPLRERTSYKQKYEYRILSNGERELARVIEQPVTKSVDMHHGLPIGKPFVFDFTDVPLTR